MQAFIRRSIDFCIRYRTVSIASVHCLSWLVMIFQLIFVRSLWPIIIPLLFVPTVSYFLSNFSITDTDDRKKAVKSYYNTWVPSVSIFVNWIIIAAIPTITILEKNFDIRRVLCVIADIILIAVMTYALHRPVMKVKLLRMADVNLPSKFNIDLASIEKSMGDIVICKNKDTKQDVVIPRKDRFLHMLILGPTGSGKTSQTILPMLNQDLQNPDAGITVIEPKGDLAEKAYAMAQYYGRRAIYFNPVLESCPTFNPLYGKEEDVIENIVTTFKMLNPDSAQYFQDMNEQLLRNALKVLKRTMGNRATLIDLSRLISNTAGSGRKLVQSEFNSIDAPTDAIAKENDDIANYFLSDYFNEKSKTFENTSGVRSQVAKIVSNKFLRRVLNPEGKSDIDFDHHLEAGTVICISTAQGKLRDLGRFLGYFIILNFQSSTFKRAGNENTRRDHFLYIDEFQSYSNPGFADMLTQGRSYRVASHLATQNRALIGMGSGRDGDDFIELVSTNARNIILFPGGNYNDAKYYSEQFGEIEKITIGESSSRQAASPLIVGKAQPAKDTFQIKEETEARMSPTDIILRPFGEITYSIVQKNTLQPAAIGKISYIDADLNKLLDQMVEENNIMMNVGVDPNKFRDFNNHGKMTDNLDWEAVQRDYNAMIEREQEILTKRREETTREEKSKYDMSQPGEEKKEPPKTPPNDTHDDRQNKSTGIRIDDTVKKPNIPTISDDEFDDFI